MEDFQKKMNNYFNDSYVKNNVKKKFNKLY